MNPSEENKETTSNNVQSENQNWKLSSDTQCVMLSCTHKGANLEKKILNILISVRVKVEGEVKCREGAQTLINMCLSYTFKK